MNVFSKKEKITIFSVLLVMFAIFTFTDLSISKAIFNIDSLYGKFFEAFGEMPGLAVGVFCLGILIVHRDTTNKTKSLISLIGYGVLMIFLALMSGIMGIHYIVEDMTMRFIIGGGIGILLIIASLFVASKIDCKNKSIIIKVAIIGLLLTAVALIGINVIKPIVGRLRFRNMVEPYEYFTSWYVIQAEKLNVIPGVLTGEAYKSFPSGHTANATIIVWITLLPLLFTKLRNKRTVRIIKIIAFAFVFMVAISRVIMGAHFATDVTFGAAFTISSFLLLESIFLKDSKVEYVVVI